LFFLHSKKPKNKRGTGGGVKHQKPPQHKTTPQHTIGHHQTFSPPQPLCPPDYCCFPPLTKLRLAKKKDHKGGWEKREYSPLQGLRGPPQPHPPTHPQPPPTKNTNLNPFGVGWGSVFSPTRRPNALKPPQNKDPQPKPKGVGRLWGLFGKNRSGVWVVGVVQ